MKRSKKYIILLCILTILISLWISSLRTENFEEKKKRLALIVRGEAFRKGGQFNRDHGNEETFDEQKKACSTHMDLIKKIESMGYAVDVYIVTYSTKFNKDLESWYGSYLKKCIFHEKHLDSQAKLIESGIHLMKSQMINYDSVLILRVDLFLKDKFIDEYKPDTNTIQFLCIMWTKNQKTPKGNPRVNDILYHFPNRFFNKMNTIFSTNNDGHDFLDVEPLEYKKEFSVLTTNLYDSDSAKDLNPYYRIIARPEAKEWFDKGKEYPTDFK